MNHSTSHTLRKFSFGSLGLLPLACGFAQEIEPKKEEPSPQGKELKEIVVTSDLWQSLLSDIPASVSVYDAEALKNPPLRGFDRTHTQPHLHGRHLATTVFSIARYGRKLAVRGRDAGFLRALSRR
jgi:hypothetical protein